MKGSGGRAMATRNRTLDAENRMKGSGGRAMATRNRTLDACITTATDTPSDAAATNTPSDAAATNTPSDAAATNTPSDAAATRIGGGALAAGNSMLATSANHATHNDINIISRSSSTDSDGSSYTRQSGFIQTFVFVDLETSGLDYARITELSLMAVSRYDLERMESRNKRATVKNIRKTPRNLNKNTYYNHSRLPYKRVVVYNNNSRSNPLNEEKDQRIFNAKRKLFATPPRSISSDYESSSKEGLVNLEVISSTDIHHISSECGQPDSTAVRQGTTDAGKLSSSVTNVATDTLDFYPRRHTSHFYKVPEVPRVVHRLTRLFYPNKMIYPICEDITGLNNIMLEHTPIMSAEFCRSFKEFLNLPKPVCLVGHNSNRCDFPIMMAEFINATDCQFDCSDILCADTLDALKLLDKIEIHEEIQVTMALVDTHSDWWASDVFSCPQENDTKKLCMEESFAADVLDHASNYAQMERACTLPNEQTIHTQAGPSFSSGILSNTPERTKDCNPFVAGTSSHRTPVQVSVLKNNCEAPETPVTPTKQSQMLSVSRNYHEMSPSPPSTPPNSPDANENKLPKRYGIRCNVPREKLITFPRNCSFKSKVHLTRLNKDYNLGFQKYKTPFSQPVLYHRLFGRNYNAHRAENDCMALMEICGHYGDKFTRVIDIIKIPLDTVKPSWLKTKSLKSENFDKRWLK